MCIGGSDKNETRHKSLDSIVHGISRMGEPLMEALLDFKVFFTNRHYDVQFGRIDIESMDWFPGGISNENMNKWAAELLDDPPLLYLSPPNERTRASCLSRQTTRRPPCRRSASSRPSRKRVRSITSPCGLRVLQAPHAGRQQSANASDGGSSSGGGWSEH